MCGTCGCSDHNGGVTIHKPGDREEEGYNRHFHDLHDSHPMEHDHHHGSGHTHSHSDERELRLERDILAQNNLMAERNRGYFEGKEIIALNIISSPGSGKTTLLEQTIQALKKEIKFSVIEGDQQTTNDADRIDATGVPVVQINTGSGCHLEAGMIQQALKKLQPEMESVLLIENVGNLVCPALFDLGESFRIVIFSVTEGDDKPLKYPLVFESADICVINKRDLLPHVNFDVKKAKEYAHRVNPKLVFFETSATTGEGMQEWLNWLKFRKPAAV